MKPASFRTLSGLIDIGRGRKALLKRINAGEHPEILIRAKVGDAFSGDDGESISFYFDPLSVHEIEP